MEAHRQSEAVEPGKSVDLDAGGAWTDLFDADDADRAVKFIVQVPDTNTEDVTIRLTTAALSASAVFGEGFVLKPGGVWEEPNYAGAVCAKLAAAAAESVSVVIV